LRFYAIVAKSSRSQQPSDILTMTTIITNAAAIIANYNPTLADLFIAQPLRRVDLAFAFAAGFAENEYGDIHPTASLIIRAALCDRENRLATN